MNKLHFLRSFSFLLLLFWSTRELKSCNIASLNSLEKEHKKIYTIGIICGETNKPSASEIALQKNFLSYLKSAPTETAIIVLRLKRSIKDSGDDEVYTFHDVVEQLAFRDKLQSGNLKYITLSYDKEDALEDIRGAIAMVNDPLMLNSCTSFYQLPKIKSVSELELFFDQGELHSDFKERNNFFSKQGLFFKYKQRVIEVAKKVNCPSVKDYIDLMENYNKKIMNSADSQIITPLKDKWVIAKKNACSYLAVQNNENKNMLLVEVQLQIIAQKKSFLLGMDEFNTKAMRPIDIIAEIEHTLVMLEALSLYDRIIFCKSIVGLKNIHSSLEKLGFKGDYKGFEINSSETASVIIGENDRGENTIVSTEDVEVFFDSIKGIARSDNKTSLPKDTNFTSCYVDSDSSIPFSKKPIKDFSEKICVACEKKLSTLDACAETETGIYCSLKCLLSKLFEEEKTNQKLRTLLDENRLLIDEDKQILAQCGALCFLQAACLTPSIVQENGLVYQLPLAKITEFLKKLETECKENSLSPSWEQSLELMSYWGISITSLKFFFGVYDKVKQEYLQGLLKNALERPYKSFKGEKCTIFDEKNGCITYQGIIFTNLKKSLKLSERTKNLSLLFLYNELIERITKRVDLSFESIEKMLISSSQNNDRKEVNNDLTEVLKKLGYKEEASFIKKKNTLPKKLLELSDDENSSEEEREDVSTPSLPCNLIHTSSQAIDDTGFSIVQRKQQKKIHVITALFAKRVPSIIRIFKAREHAPELLKGAFKIWEHCNKWFESRRVQILFGLMELLQNKETTVIESNNYGVPSIKYGDEYSSSFGEKLDLSHLFTRKVDKYVRSCGIAEEIGDNLIQVSIPGELITQQGRKVGFFQYSFTSGTWVCIHRCFKNYDAPAYISTALRKILYDFLKSSCDNEKYQDVIKDLEQLLQL